MVVPGTLAAQEAQGYSESPATPAKGDIIETAVAAGSFTVFAPTDEAFGKLPEGTVDALLKDKANLTAILTYHVVPGTVMSKEVAGMSSAKTVNGQELSIKAKGGKVLMPEQMPDLWERRGHPSP